MATKRKDSQGHVLRDGESQRADGRYQYRYTDSLGKRHTVYDTDIKSLREKETEIQKLLSSGVDYAKGNIPVTELVERYLSLKQGLRPTTIKQYTSMLNRLREEPFGNRLVSSVKTSDAKRWIISLHDNGLKSSSVRNTYGFIRAAFQMAYEEDVITKNPFCFRFSDVLRNDKEPRTALTPEQQRLWMDFIRSSSYYSKYYDSFVVLFGTGMRIGEFTALTISDLDFQNRKIRIDHQLVYTLSDGLHIGKPKTKSGTRFIPMSDEVYKSLQSMLVLRNTTIEPMIDGYSGFLSLTKNGEVRSAKTWDGIVSNARNSYNKLHPDTPLPHITPHVFRHTFCTAMANSGMDIKALQYIMGHANSAVTLDVYAHTSYEHAESQMKNVVDFQQAKQRVAN